MNALQRSFAFSKDKYFLALRLSICSLKVKMLSIMIPSKTTFLLSSISLEFIINSTEFRFFFPKIMNGNLPGLAC